MTSANKTNLSVCVINLVRRGGMVHYHAQLVKALADTVSVRVVVASSVEDGYFDNKISRTRIDTGKSAKEMLLKLLWPGTWWRMFTVLINIDEDVVHVTSPYLWNIFIVWWVRRPLAYTVHDPKPHSGERWHVKKIDELLRRKASLLFVHGESAKQDLINEGYSPEAIIVVPHGRYELTADKSMQANLKNQLLFFGRIEDYKGLDILLKAMPKIWSEYPDWNLMVAGHGDISPHKAWMNDERIIIRNDFIPDEEVGKYFQESRLVVLPYKNATQSGVIPIAAAYSRPVVASRVGAIPDMVVDGKTGILVEPSSASALASAVNSLLSNPKLIDQMGVSAHKFISKLADWRPIGQMHFHAYSRILTQEKKP